MSKNKVNKIILHPKVFELGESNDIYMTLKMVILTSNANLNGARFTEGFIDGICNNQDKFRGIGLVVNRVKLENEVYDSLTHEFDGNSLNTDMIGSFVGFEKTENIDGSYSLIGEARVLKRFPKTCEAILQLYEEETLRFSCEALIKSYTANEDGTRDIPWANGSNLLIGNCIVTSPAEVDAIPTLLVASLEKDLKEGGQLMDKFEFNNGVVIVNEGIIETAELSFDDITNQVYNQLNPKDADGYRSYNFWIKKAFPSHVIVENWNVEGELWQVNYSVDNDVVTVANPESWLKGEMVFKAIETAEENTNEDTPNVEETEGEVVETAEEGTEEVSAEETVVEETPVVEGEETTVETNEETKEVPAEETPVVEEVSVNELQSTVITLQNKVTQLMDEVESLKPFKEAHEMAERTKKQNELKVFALSSKQISETELVENEEIKNAIETCDENAISNIIAKRIVEQNKIETASKTIGNQVTITVAEAQDLMPQDILSKYGLGNK